MKGLIGRKLGMTQIFNEQGAMIPVTVLEVGPCFVTQIKTPVTEGYAAIQLGFEEIAERHLTGGERGHLKKARASAVRILREFRIKEEEIGDYRTGQKLQADVFSVGDVVDVAGISKGKGFQGGVKRHGFNRQTQNPRRFRSHSRPWFRRPRLHAGPRVQRQAQPRSHGSRACHRAEPASVVLVDPTRNLLAVRGAVPGPKNGLITVAAARKQVR